VAATNELIKEQTELEKQRMLIAQQQQEQNEISLENQRVIDNINAAQSQDTSSSDNGGSSSSSTSNGEVTEEEDKHDIQIDDKSHYAIAQIPEGFGLYKISSNKKTLSDSIQTIRPVKIFDSAGAAISALSVNSICTYYYRIPQGLLPGLLVGGVVALLLNLNFISQRINQFM
jgi:hypothetical protein